MITVHLYGHLHKLFGSAYQLDVASPAEAVRALEANFPGKFLNAFKDFDYCVVRGSDLQTGEYDTEDTLLLERQQDIHFVPTLEGDKDDGPLGYIVAGVLIIATAGYGALAAGFLTAGAEATMLGAVAAGAGATFLGISYGTYMAFGAAMLFGGIAQLLTPVPNDPKSEDSYIFEGAVNVAGQGICVPLIYGEVETGSIVLSESLIAEQIG